VERYETPDIYERFLRAHISRRALFKAAGAAGAGLALAQAGLLREAAAASETVQDILNTTITVEHFGVTFLGTGLANIRAGTFSKPVPTNVVAVVEAARAQEQFHLDFFKQAGGVPLTTSFTLPDPALVTDFDKFFTAIVEQETRETAAQIAAMSTFVALQRPDLVKIAFQYGAEEAEHRLLANYTRGVRPANDHGFAPAPYATAAEILADMRKVGLIGGTGPQIVSPGPGTIDPTNVIERVPGGVAVACAATAPTMPGLPNTGGGFGASGGSGTGTTLGVLGLGLAAAAAVAARRRRAAGAAAADGDKR